MTLLMVAVGGFVGAPLRYHLDRLVQRRLDGAFPWGTFAVNLIGCLLLGFLVQVCSGTRLYDLVGVGFCGALTTYSTFGYETLRLTEDGARPLALVNVVASVVLGLLAAFAGWTLGGLWG